MSSRASVHLPALVTVLLVALSLGGCRRLAGHASAASDDGGADHGLRDAPPLEVGRSAGATLWSRTCSATNAAGAGKLQAVAEGLSVAVDSAGSVYVAGVINGPKGTLGACGELAVEFRGREDILLLKLSPQGVVLWVVTAGGSGVDGASAVSVTAKGEVYLAGHFSGVATLGGTTLTASSGKDGFVAKLSAATGGFSWVRQVYGGGDEKVLGLANTGGGPVAVGWFSGKSVNVKRPRDGQDVIITSRTNTKAGKKDVFIVKLDASGGPGWLTSAGGEDDDVAERVAVEQVSGRIFASGYFLSKSLKFGGATLQGKGQHDALVVALDATGAPRNGIGLGGSVSEEAYGIAVAGGDPVFTGWYRSRLAPFGSSTLTKPADQDDDLFVARYDANTATVSATGLGSMQGEAGFGVTLLPDNDVVVVGVSGGDFDFGSTAVGAGHRILVGRLSGKLEPRAAATAKVGGGRAWSVAVDSTGDLIVSGFFSGTAIFGSSSAKALGKRDLFVWKLTPP